MFDRIKDVWRDEAGLTTVEYVLLIALLAVAALSVWGAYGGTVSGKVATSGNSFNGIS